MNKFKFLLYAILFICFISFVSFTGWYIKKTFSYAFFYESSVEATIKKMVKSECLK